MNFGLQRKMFNRVDRIYLIELFPYCILLFRDKKNIELNCRIIYSRFKKNQNFNYI